MQRNQVSPKIFKVAIVGESQSGKTSLFLRFTENKRFGKIPKNYTDRKQVDLDLEEKLISLHIRDTHCMSVSTDKSELHQVQGVIITVDLTNAQALERAQNWLIEVDRCVPQAIKVLAGTKGDLKKQRKISDPDIQQFVKAHKLAYVATSSWENINVERVFKKLALAILYTFTPSKADKAVSEMTRFLQFSATVPAAITNDNHEEKKEKSSEKKLTLDPLLTAKTPQAKNLFEYENVLRVLNELNAANLILALANAKLLYKTQNKEFLSSSIFRSIKAKKRLPDFKKITNDNAKQILLDILLGDGESGVNSLKYKIVQAIFGGAADSAEKANLAILAVTSVLNELLNNNIHSVTDAVAEHHKSIRNNMHPL